MVIDETNKLGDNGHIVKMHLEALVARQWLHDVLGNRAAAMSDLQGIVSLATTLEIRDVLIEAYMGLAWHAHFTDVGKAKVDGLIWNRPPACFLHKHWARQDSESPSGGGYVFTFIPVDLENTVF